MAAGKTTTVKNKRKTPKGNNAQPTVAIHIDPEELKNLHYENESRALDGMLKYAKLAPGRFTNALLVQAVIHAAGQVLRIENGGTAQDINRARAEYTKTLKKVKDAVGPEYDELYAQGVRESNECSRENLKNSDGRMYCYVIPAFNDDGTHAPLGPRDFPWNQGKKV